MAAAKNSHTRNTNDPRIAVLKVAMNSPNNRVRLAAAGSLIEIAAYSGTDLSGAVQVLEDISANSEVKGYRTDSDYYLNLVKRIKTR